MITVHSHHFNLKSQLQAAKTLFPNHTIEVTAQGPFEDIENETIFGNVNVTEVRRTNFTFEADGNEYEARIADVTMGFYIYIMEA